MELAFETKELRAICESESEARAHLPGDVVEMLKHRLADMIAATTAADLVVGNPRLVLDIGRPHILVDLCDGYRLVFKSNHINRPGRVLDETDRSRVTRVKILAVERDRA